MMPLRRKNSGMDAITDFSTPGEVQGTRPLLSATRQALLLYLLRFPSLSPFKKSAEHRDVLLGSVLRWRRVNAIVKRPACRAIKTLLSKAGTSRAKRTAILGLFATLVKTMMLSRAFMPVYYNYNNIVSSVFYSFSLLYLFYIAVTYYR